MSSSIQLTQRVLKLREALLNLVHTQYREVKDLSILHDADVLKEPLVVRKALALSLLLDETPALIMENELIIGLRSVYGPMKGESEAEWTNFVKPATRFNRFYYPHYATIAEINEAQKMSGYSSEFSLEGHATAHIPYGVEKVLTLGIGGIIEQTKYKMKTLTRSSPQYTKQRDFLRAVVIAYQAASRFVIKHAEEAEHQIQETDDLTRQKELNRIAAICRWISVNPARTFYEALQLFWFGYLIQHIENYFSGPLARFDQYMYPYFKRDLEEGRITQEEVVELIECLFIKCCDEDDLSTDTHANIMLSGQDSAGNDATNELTYLCLDVAAALGLADPKISVRIHQRTPLILLRRCCEIIKDGRIGGFPSLYNDDAIIPAIQRVDIPLEDARLYSNDGCQETIIPGKGDFYPSSGAGRINLLDTLNQILQKVSSEWSTFDQLMEAYKKEIATTIKKEVDKMNSFDVMLPTISPVPYLSATLDGCIETARDKTDGGAIYNYTGFLGQALANAANSLAVIKRCVYDDKIFSLAQLHLMLSQNWEGYERLRQLVLNKVPKYGNDNDYVDSLAVEIGEFFIREVLQYRNPRGGRYYPGFYVFLQVHTGMNVHASPDGRKTGEAVAIHASPTVGTDLSGPTAVINSALKVSKLLPPEGAPLDIRFHPSALRGEEGLEKLMAFVQTYMNQDGIQLQFNIVEAETLRDAQQNPERHKDLIVRVWGFSAYFVTLSKEYQENIITRAEHIL